ncbi:MAG: hypothetical protein PWQ28_518, partial [Candidatus Woesearchaeota archaeon]|nr:hypothetical protein [Candidatus Woesearchaeota archaeon]
MNSLKKLKEAKDKLRKNVSTFITSEDASLAKQALLGLGAVVVSSSIIGSVKAAIAHSNTSTASISGDYAVGQHTHHSTHSTHSTHGTHTTHGTHSTHSTHGTHTTHGTHSTHSTHGTHTT